MGKGMGGLASIPRAGAPLATAMRLSGKLCCGADERQLRCIVQRSEANERQRRSSLQPRVARHELPWVISANILNRNAVAANSFSRRPHLDTATTSLRLFRIRPVHPR